jgi:DNA-binding NtrC family response regulator
MGPVLALPAECTMTSGPRYKILLVEDEALIAADMADMLRRAGCEVVGPFADIGSALAALQSKRVDCALLDVNLGGQMSYPVADAAVAASVPIVWATGYDKADLPSRHRGGAFLQKPFAANDVLEAVSDVLAKTPERRSL